MNPNKFWDLVKQTIFFVYLILATWALILWINDWLPKFIFLDLGWLDTPFAKWSGYFLTIYPGLISLLALVPTVTFWFLAFNNGQLWFVFFFLFNQRDGYLFSATRASNPLKQNQRLHKAKVQLIESKLYELNGYFKELGIVSNSKKSITKPTQFNLRGCKEGGGNYGFVFQDYFYSKEQYKEHNAPAIAIGDELTNSADKVLTLWKPFLNTKITGLTAYAVQLAIITDYLNVVISESQAEIIWEAIFSCYNPSPSNGIDNITRSDLPVIRDLLSLYFRDTKVMNDFRIEIGKLNQTNLSAQIYLTFKSFIRK